MSKAEGDRRRLARPRGTAEGDAVAFLAFSLPVVSRGGRCAASPQARSRAGGIGGPSRGIGRRRAAEPAAACSRRPDQPAA